MAASSPAVAKGKGKGAPPPLPKDVCKPPSVTAHAGPKVKVLQGELKSAGATVVTSVDGTRRIEHADGTVEMLTAGSKPRRCNFADIFALRALTIERPELLSCARSFSAGVPISGLESRLRQDFGDAVKDAFIAAAAEHWRDLDADTDGPQHGRFGDASWPLPTIAARCDSLARPGYRAGVAHEYLDDEEVLRAKVALLAGLLRKAKHAIVYGGAGLSTSSGILDYATKTGQAGVLGQSKGSGKAKGKGTVSAAPTSFYTATPNLGHRTIAALAAEGLMWRFVQQNHDGLPQKAGVPQKLMNEIHGGLFDPSNPIVKMSGNLRGDLFKDMLLCERKADLVLTLGSSLAGMNADRLVKTCAERAKIGTALGSVIVSLQTTPHDAAASVRIYATIDRTMELLVEQLGLDLRPEAQALPSVPACHRPLGPDEDVFEVPYDDQGQRLSEDNQPPLRWDLRERSVHTITDGPQKGARALILGKTEDGHYRVGFRINPNFQGDYQEIRLMGSWWVTQAATGDVGSLPIVNRNE